MNPFVRTSRIATTLAALMLACGLPARAERATVDLNQELSSSPRISSIAPAASANERTPQTLTVNGQDFIEGLSLEVTSPEGQTRVVSGQDIHALRGASFQVALLLSRGGIYTFIVRNTDGGASNAFPLKVTPTGTAPSIERVEPESVPRGTSPQRFTVVGKNFMAGLSITLTDPTGEVTVIREGLGQVSPTSFTVDLTLTVSGEYSLLVTNPNKEDSNSVTLTVTHFQTVFPSTPGH